METWKLSINTSSQDGYDPFQFCRENSLIGVGWSGAYDETAPTELEDVKAAVVNRYGTWPSAINTLLLKVSSGDHVWLHKNGKYYLCVVGEKNIYGPDINLSFKKLDLGHCKSARWVEVPDFLVSGRVQRGTIAQRMIQRINVTDEELVYHGKLFEILSVDLGWVPEIDESDFSSLLTKFDLFEFLNLLTPDDVEDLVCSKLQSEGWYLIKSTCFRSKPVFEFMMLNKERVSCHVQVKSGRNPDPLRPESYQRFVSGKKVIKLFSTSPNAYPGPEVEGVECMGRQKLFGWIKQNPWALTEPLKQRLWVYISSKD